MYRYMDHKSYYDFQDKKIQLNKRVKDLTYCGHPFCDGDLPRRRVPKEE